MCGTCGCGASEHGHGHARSGLEGRRLRLERDLLARNRERGERLRARLSARGITAINLLSSPGSGKTSLLERSVAALDEPVYVVEGDQAGSRDADRLRAAGARAFQVNTGAGCHLDAAAVEAALAELSPPDGALVFIENVGNLVCPALFDVGEHARAVIASVTEGEDKPIKYPHAFRGADVLLLNKIDLIPHLDFDRAAFDAALAQVRPGLELIATSARSGENLDSWLSWLAKRRARPRREGAR